MELKPWELGLGGVGIECPNKDRRWSRDRTSWICGCGTCSKCGHTLHSAVHVHAYGCKPGDAPFDHRFVPKKAHPTA